MDYQQPDFYKFNDDSTFLLKNVFDDFSNDSQLIDLLDLCCGCGILGIESANYFINAHRIHFLEIQNQYEQYLLENVKNLLKQKLKVEYFFKSFEDGLNFKYDLILCNPPYFEINDSRTSPDLNKSISRHYIKGSLLSLVRITLAHLKNADSRAYILMRGDHKDFNRVKNEFKKSIIKIINKGKVELVVFKNEKRDKQFSEL